MAGSQQKNIGLSPREKAALDRAKKRYEEMTGDRGDYGNFISNIVAMGLVALGIYGLVKFNREHPSVTCPFCKGEFTVAYSPDITRIAYVNCPNCKGELVVDFGTKPQNT